MNILLNWYILSGHLVHTKHLSQKYPKMKGASGPPLDNSVCTNCSTLNFSELQSSSVWRGVGYPLDVWVSFRMVLEGFRRVLAQIGNFQKNLKFWSFGFGVRTLGRKSRPFAWNCGSQLRGSDFFWKITNLFCEADGTLWGPDFFREKVWTFLVWTAQ